MQARRAVVVGVDGTHSAQCAVRWGAAEASRRRVPLRLVTAYGWPPERRFEGLDVALDGDQQSDRVRGELAGAAAIAELAAPGVRIERQATAGHPVSVLVDESGRAQLIVVGDRGAGRVEAAVAGSVAVAVATHATCPVVVVRGCERELWEVATRPVVVGVDGSATGEAAIAFAFETASARGVSLVAVHAWPDRTPDRPVTDSAERELLSQRLAGWTEKYPDVRVSQVVTRSRPADGLLARAATAQLVVVGSRGWSGFSGLVLGSVSHALVHRSPCPVAVVRPNPTGGVTG